MGQVAAQNLLKLIEDSSYDANHEFPTPLTIRESVKNSSISGKSLSKEFSTF